VTLGIGPEFLSLDPSLAPLPGLGIEASFGGAVSLLGSPSNNLALHVEGNFGQSYFSRLGQQVDVAHFGVAAGPQLSLAHGGLGLGFFGMATANEFYSRHPFHFLDDPRTFDVDHQAAIALGVRGVLSFLDEAAHLSYSYQQVLGTLEVTEFSKGPQPLQLRPSSHSLMFSIDPLSIGRQISRSHREIYRNAASLLRETEVNIHTAGSFTSDLIHPIERTEVAYRAIDRSTRMPHYNGTLVTLEHKPNARMPIGFNLGLQIGQDYFLNPTYSPSLRVLSDSLTLAILPASVSYALTPSVTVEGGIFLFPMGGESAFFQDRTPFDLGLLYVNTQPFTGEGVRGTWAINAAHSLAFLLTNSTDRFLDHSAALSGTAVWNYSSGNHALALSALAGGEEVTEGNHNYFRGILDGVYTLTLPNDKLVVNATLNERTLNPSVGPLLIMGVSAFYSHSLPCGTQFYGRLEGVYDQGQLTSSEQGLGSLAAGVRHTLRTRAGNFTFYLQARADASTAQVFPGDSHFAATATLGSVWSLRLHQAQTPQP